MEVVCDICFVNCKKSGGIQVRELKGLDLDCKSFVEIVRKICILSFDTVMEFRV